MGFTPVNGNKHHGVERRGASGVKTKKSLKMLSQIPNPRPLHIINLSQVQPHLPNPFAYAQQRGRANPALDASYLKRPRRAPPGPPRGHVPNLREVPTLYPSRAEFADPEVYMNSLKKFESYGMVKIVPPDGWFPSLAIDTELFTFRTIHQLINKNTDEKGLRQEFNDALKYFHEKTGRRSGAPFKIPLIHKRPLNMYLLHRCVQLRGGLQEVSRRKMWQQIGRELGYSGKIMSSLSTSLRNSYQKLLTPFDDYLLAHGVNLSSSPRLVRFKIAPESEAMPGEIKLPIGIIITMVCPPPNWTPDRFSEISNSTTVRFRRPAPPWVDGKYSPLNSSEQDASYNLKQFQIKSDSFRDTYFRSGAREQDVEQEFWRVLGTPGESLDVEYGYSMTPCSGFSHDWVNPWNFDRISTSDGSFLRYANNEVMSRPRLDVGSLFAAKAWASEPFCGSKISFSHLGATRTWYSTPPLNFPDLQNYLDVRFNECMVSPAQLGRMGIPCYFADQRPGEIIVVFPRVWHSHVNHGFNLNESVNFLPKDWLETGKGMLECYKRLSLPAPFSLDELLCTSAGSDNCEMLLLTIPELEAIYEREKGFTTKFKQASSSGGEYKRKVCVKTGQPMALSWVSTPQGPMDPSLAEAGSLHTSYGNVDEYFGGLIAVAKRKLQESRDYIGYVCRNVLSKPQLSSEQLEGLATQGPFHSRCRAIKALLGRWVLDSRRLSHNCLNEIVQTSIYGEKKTLEWVDSVIGEFNKAICISPELGRVNMLKEEHNKYLAGLLRMINGIQGKQPAGFLDALLSQSDSLPVISPMRAELVKVVKQVEWANRVNEMLSLQPLVFLGQIEQLLLESKQLGISTRSAFFRYLKERREAGLKLHGRAERVAFWEKVDPQELDYILEAAQSAPIDEQIYMRLQLYKSVHSIVAGLQAAQVAERPRLSEAGKYRMVNAQVGDAVTECEQWIGAFGPPDQVFAQAEAAAANGMLPTLCMYPMPQVMMLFAKLDYLQVIPDNFEQWARCRQIIHQLAALDPARLQRYGFV